jgi:hypothetical protein
MELSEDEAKGKAPAASVVPQGVTEALTAAALAGVAEPKGAATQTAPSTVSTGKCVDLCLHLVTGVWCAVQDLLLPVNTAHRGVNWMLMPG